MSGRVRRNPSLSQPWLHKATLSQKKGQKGGKERGRKGEGQAGKEVGRGWGKEKEGEGWDREGKGESKQGYGGFNAIS